MTTAEESFNAARAEEFAGQLIGAINGASVVALTSIGSQTGLFDAMAPLPPSSSQAIAEAAGLNERYVREWLGGMVLGKVIEYDADAGTYQLPPEHAAFLTAAGGPNNLATIARVFPYLGLIEPELKKSFRTGGGVPYASYPDFQEIQAGMTGAYLEAGLVETVLPLAEGVVDNLRGGADVLDIGTGAGHAVNLMAQAFPDSRFAGYDFSAEGITMAQAEAAALGLSNTRFEVKDVAAVSERERYDLITAIELVHDLAHPAETLRAVYHALKPGGTLLVVDIAASSKLEENYEHPLGPTLFAFSVFHCMTVSLSQGGAGLGTVVGEQKLTRLLSEAGFQEVEVKHVDGDVFYAYFIARK